MYQIPNQSKPPPNRGKPKEIGGSWRPPGCASHAPRSSRLFPAWRPGSRAYEAPARCRPKAPRRWPTGNRGPVLGVSLLRRQPSRLSHKAGGCPMKIGGVPLLRLQPNWGRLSQIKLAGVCPLKMGGASPLGLPKTGRCPRKMVGALVVFLLFPLTYQQKRSKSHVDSSSHVVG